MLDIATGYEKKFLTLVDLTSPFLFKGLLRCILIFFFIKLRIKRFEQKRPKKTPPHSVAPHLGVQCSHIFHKKDAGLYGVELSDIFLHKEVFKQ